MIDQYLVSFIRYANDDSGFEILAFRLTLRVRARRVSHTTYTVNSDMVMFYITISLCSGELDLTGDTRRAAAAASQRQ